VNRFQNENMLKEFKSWVSENPSQDILDLYAGSGNFTFPLLELFPKAKIQAVELSSAAVKKAHELLKSRNVSFHQVKFILSDVELFLKRQELKPEQLVVLDPPRIGCSENVMRYLAAAGIQRIIYISCQHTAFARDFMRLQNHAQSLAKGRYEITKVQPFDMFPQTDHIEIMAEIVLRPQ
jgi:23S rRNA (uracil1939-C5)-methyltransferase